MEKRQEVTRERVIAARDALNEAYERVNDIILECEIRFTKLNLFPTAIKLYIIDKCETRAKHVKYVLSLDKDRDGLGLFVRGPDRKRIRLIDAPRHVRLKSLENIKKIARKAGFYHGMIESGDMDCTI